MTGSRHKTVLVADDDGSVRRLVGLALELEGFSVVTAADGTEALTGADELHPHAIVLDAVMPGLDGLEVCRRLRASPGRTPAVVMITGRTDLADRLAAFESGVDDYVVKPVRVMELVERVKTLVEGRTLSPSRLLGGPQVADELDRRVRAGQSVAAAFIEVRGVAPFARRYSYPRAERLLAHATDLFVQLADGMAGTLVGRLAGEEFAVGSVLLVTAGLSTSVASWRAMKADEQQERVHRRAATATTAGALALEVVAEGVEGTDHLAFRRDAGCRLGQGYLFARPRPVT